MGRRRRRGRGLAIAGAVVIVGAAAKRGTRLLLFTKSSRHVFEKAAVRLNSVAV
jgi:hypothetical protein